MLPSRRILAPFSVLILFPILARCQGPIAPPRSTEDSVYAYQNSPEGLRWELQDILNVARNHNRLRLEFLIRQTEIPGSGEWFLTSFGREKGNQWAAASAGNLKANEKYFADALSQVAGEDGEFEIRRVNDDPAPARKVETAMIEALQRPVDIFFASWKKRNSGQDSTPIGYFVFLDGRFRLDSAVGAAELQLDSAASKPSPQGVATSIPMPSQPATSANGAVPYRPGTAGIGYPSCDSCPDPPYTAPARKKRLEGTVVLQAIVQPNGDVTDIQVVKTPSPDLAQMAVDGVSTWHMKPARRADGEAVPVIVPIEVTFRLVK